MLLLFDVFSQPASKRLLAKISGRERLHDRDAIRVVGVENPSVQVKKQFHHDERGSLVAVKKRMITRNTKRVRCRERSFVHVFAISFQIVRPRQGRTEQTRISNTRNATMLS